MPSVLTSWKEISEHLGKGVRTVQRWELELGLPVHRSEGGSARALFAVPEELDAWARSHPRAPTAAIVGSLHREIAALREELKELRQRQDNMELAAIQSSWVMNSGADSGWTAYALQTGLRQARMALRATIGKSQVLRGESQAARGQSEALRRIIRPVQRLRDTSGRAAAGAGERGNARARISSAG